jgi:hypothetical protein
MNHRLLIDSPRRKAMPPTAPAPMSATSTHTSHGTDALASASCFTPVISSLPVLRPPAVRVR